MVASLGHTWNKRACVLYLKNNLAYTSRIKYLNEKIQSQRISDGLNWTNYFTTTSFLSVRQKTGKKWREKVEAAIKLNDNKNTTKGEKSS